MIPAGRLDRRAFLQGAAGLGVVLAAIPPPRWRAARLMTAESASGAGRFLSTNEPSTLEALCDRLLPGPPEDPDPGALEAGCPAAIDLLLGSLDVDPPLVFAGGPWSNRAGGRIDDMADFIPLDQLQELGWRIYLEGSKGMPEREFGGPVTGLQEVYSQGLANLDRLAGGPGRFAAASHRRQETAMRDPSAGGFVAQAISDTVSAMYGPPEYGGNRGLVGWTATHWPGDAQPRGYSDSEVREPDPGRRSLPYTVEEAKGLVSSILPGFEIVE